MLNINNIHFFNSGGFPITTQVNRMLTFKLSTSKSQTGFGAEGSVVINRQGKIECLDLTSKGSNYILSVYKEEVDIPSISYRVSEIESEQSKVYKDQYGPIDYVGIFYNGVQIAAFEAEFFDIYYEEVFYKIGYSHKSYYAVHSIRPKEEFVNKMLIRLEEDVDKSSYYPGFAISGNIDLEPCSTGLVGSEAIFVLEHSEELDENNKRLYFRPISEGQKLVFSLNNQNIRFVTSDYKTESLVWKNKVSFDLHEDDELSKEPLYCNIGFLGEVEGIYEEFLQLYLVDKVIQSDGSFKEEYSSIGMIHIGAEAVDEDSRFRTLFTNLGVPDPINYPTLFKEVNPKEEGVNWEIVNKKSKELFLTYTEIFPYVGTYKALINAVKFLGYDDIIFKEWFKYIGKDNQNAEYLGYQCLDISLGELLSSKLSKLNLTTNDNSEDGIWKTWFDYKKLNKLSMHYQINKTTGGNEIVKGVSHNNGIETQFMFEIPETINTYEYSNEEVLIKLFALREWLEKNIIGVNCRITDITGEGVYFERFKTPIYSTHHYVVDHIKNLPMSPYPVVDSDKDYVMIDSSAVVQCSLHEYDNLTVGDYADITFWHFFNNVHSAEPSTLGIDSNGIRRIIPKDLFDVKDNRFFFDKYDVYNELQIPYSAPYSAPLLFNELQYDLNLVSDSGTISNVIEKIGENKNPLWIVDNEIRFYNDDVEVCNFKTLPTIRISDGVLRKKYGPYNESIVYRITSAFDVSSQSYRYMMFQDTIENNIYSIENKNYYRNKLLSFDYITLVPREDAVFKYEMNPRYEVPFFFIKNYDVILYNSEVYGENNERIIDASSYCYLGSEEFILDIYNGNIFCREDDNLEALIEFNDGHIDVHTGEAEQDINAVYNYHGKRFFPWQFDMKRFLTEHGNLLMSMTEDVEVLKNKAVERIKSSDASIEASKDASIHYLEIKNFGNPDWIKEDDSEYKFIIDECEALKTLYKDNISANFEHLKNLRVAQYEAEKSKLMASCYKINKVNEIRVNHIGNYTVASKGWDQHGNVYMNVSPTKANVYGEAPNIYVSTPYLHSMNEKDFYSTNKKGNVLDISSWISGGDTFYSKEYESYIENDVPRFLPMNRIYDLDSSGRAMLSYESISYINDSPKKNDYMLVENLSERVTHIDFDYKLTVNGSSYDKERTGLRISILDENPDTNNLFIVNASINLYFYDPTKFELYKDILYNSEFEGIAGKYQVIGYNKVDVDQDPENQNYLHCIESDRFNQFKELSDDIIEKVNSGKLRCYAANVTEYDVDAFTIENDYVNNQSTFRLSDPLLKNNFVFKKGQVIKIVFAKDYELGNSYIEDYVAMASYRIKDVSIVNVAPLDEFGEPTGYIYNQVYTVDGIINKELVTTEWYNYSNEGQNIEFNKNIHIRATYANSLFSQYVLQAKSDGSEYRGRGYVEFYNDRLLSDYIDSTYSMVLTRFVPNDAYDDWLSEKEVTYANLYEYDIPTSLYQGNQYRVTSRFEEGKNRTFKKYKSIWELYTQGNQSQMRWQVTNPYIYARAFDYGEYQFKLDAIDEYGNRTTNLGEAKMFAKTKK